MSPSPGERLGTLLVADGPMQDDELEADEEGLDPCALEAAQSPGFSEILS